VVTRHYVDLLALSRRAGWWFWEVCIQLLRAPGPARCLRKPWLSPAAACGGDRCRSPWPAHAGGSPCTCRRSAWRSGSPSRRV